MKVAAAVVQASEVEVPVEAVGVAMHLESQSDLKLNYSLGYVPRPWP